MERLKNQVNDRCLTYVENLSCRSMSDHEWELCLPDRSTLNMVESSLSDKLHEIACEILKEEGLSENVSISLSIEGEKSSQSHSSNGLLPFDAIHVTDISTPEVEKAAFQLRDNSHLNKKCAFDADYSDVMDVVPFEPDIQLRENSHLNEKFTFDTYVRGSSNELAYCAAKAVASNPAGAYNPLFIYGGVGIGKTHLMHAIGNEILQTRNLRVRYFTSEEFMNMYIACVTEKKGFQGFRDIIRRECDVLLLDDIQFVAGKEGTQKEFFNAFNDLYNAGHQIVLTSDKHPQEIRELEERIRSRLLSGLMVDIQLPEFETRLEILRNKARMEGFRLPDDVAQYVASKVTTNVRELEGCYKSIKAMAELKKASVNIELAQRIIEPYYQTRLVQLDAEAIIRCVCRYFNISVDDMLGKSRAKPFVQPRQLAMYLIRNHSGLSYPEIGRIFKRDHTTVLSACQRITKDLVDGNKPLKFDIDRLENDLFK